LKKTNIPLMYRIYNNEGVPVKKFNPIQ